ncbi:MAG: 6-bladed beta-propeller [Terriglobales bacterium]|jgi:DNA-binding beta-propeller fold protein YncE
MFALPSHSNRNRTTLAALVILLLLGLASPVSMHGSDKKKKKKAEATEPAAQPNLDIDISKLVWPNPPNIARVRYLGYYAGMKIDNTPPPTTKKKQSWMDRVAGTKQEDSTDKLKTFPWQLLGPYGLAIDSKGLVYVADQRVGAVFIFNTETHDATLIKNGTDAHFALLNGVAIDDSDRLFVSDGKLHRVLVFNPKHEVEGQIAEGLVDPVGLAIDNQNRFLYVVDEQQDLVMVYDADSLKLLRHIGTPGKKHTLTTPGDFGGATNVAVDKDGNVYVTDTMNNRVEIFDAEGNFISTFGKAGDGPGYFARPKGIAIDCDGHIWVADQYQDRVQVFNRDGQLLTYIGDGHANGPGQFKALVGIAIDKQNRVFTTEQYPGRMQMFRYITDDEAAAEKAKREADLEKAADARRGASSGTAQTPAEAPAPNPDEATPAQKPPSAPTQEPPASPPS